MIYDHDKAPLRNMAERIIAAHPGVRGQLNLNTQSAIDVLRTTIDGVTDDQLAGAFSFISSLIDYLSTLTVADLADGLNASYCNATLAAAAMAGVYDLADDEDSTETLTEVIERQVVEDKAFVDETINSLESFFRTTDPDL